MKCDRVSYSVYTCGWELCNSLWDTWFCQMPRNLFLPVAVLLWFVTWRSCAVLFWCECLLCRWISRSRVNLTPVDDASVKHVKSESQHLSAESLDECFDVFTQQERVSHVISRRAVFTWALYTYCNILLHFPIKPCQGCRTINFLITPIAAINFLVAHE